MENQVPPQGEYAKGESEFIAKYEAKGYKAGFRMDRDEQRLIENGTDNYYSPRDIKIVAQHRFEGMSNPADMSILYIIETSTGSKGTVLVPYGPASTTELAEFFNSIPKENTEQSENVLL